MSFITSSDQSCFAGHFNSLPKKKQVPLTSSHLQISRGTYFQVWVSGRKGDNLERSPSLPRLSGWSDGPEGGKQWKIKHPRSCIPSLLVSNQLVIVLMTDSINELSSCKQNGRQFTTDSELNFVVVSPWFLPQPCDPPRYGCSEWSKPPRRPFCSTKTNGRTIGESQNTGHISHSKHRLKLHWDDHWPVRGGDGSMLWFNIQFSIAYGTHGQNTKRLTWKRSALYVCCERGTVFCIRLTQPWECRMQKQSVGGFWNGARCRM